MIANLEAKKAVDSSNRLGIVISDSQFSTRAIGVASKDSRYKLRIFVLLALLLARR